MTSEVWLWRLVAVVAFVVILSIAGKPKNAGSRLVLWLVIVGVLVALVQTMER